MGQRRFTHKTNAYSKKVRNHALVVAVMMLRYFIRPHDTTGTGTGLGNRTDHVLARADRSNLPPTCSVCER